MNPSLIPIQLSNIHSIHSRYCPESFRSLSLLFTVLVTWCASAWTRIRTRWGPQYVGRRQLDGARSPDCDEQMLQQDEMGHLQIGTSSMTILETNRFTISIPKIYECLRNSDRQAHLVLKSITASPSQPLAGICGRVAPAKPIFYQYLSLSL